MLARERPAATAAIASKLCAQLYNLEILKENIEDHHANRTRFLVLSKEPGEQVGDKCSVVFSTAHTPGALFRVIKAFSDNGINLTRIESRPRVDEPGRFGFILDFQGRPADSEKLFEQIRENTTMFRVLGWYEEAR
jgi:prephenate dehydratase